MFREFPAVFLQTFGGPLANISRRGTCPLKCVYIIIISLYWDQVDNCNLLQWHIKQAATQDSTQHCTV